MGAGRKEAWKAVAEKLYETRSSIDHMERTSRLQEIFEDDEILFSPLLERCPRFIHILRFILENKFSFRVRDVDWTKKMTDWGEEECKIVGRSLAAFIIGATAGEHAVDAWRRHYVQLKILFEEVEGFEEFMLVIANNLLRDSIYGMVLRVSIGAVLSLMDAATDIYIISTYYKSAELYGQANAMLAIKIVFGQTVKLDKLKNQSETHFRTSIGRP